MKANIQIFDQGVRITAGAVAIASVMINPFVPVWFALAGAYLVLTSITAWDPVYAAFSSLRSAPGPRVRETTYPAAMQPVRIDR